MGCNTASHVQHAICHINLDAPVSGDVGIASLSSDANIYLLPFPHCVLPTCLSTQMFAMLVFAICVTLCPDPPLSH